MSEPQTDEAWQRYGRALIAAMRDVIEEADERHRELLLETADFWLGLGLVMGLRRPDEAVTLLGVMEAHADEHAELLSDADDLLANVVR